MSVAGAPQPQYRRSPSRMEPIKSAARWMGLNHVYDAVWRHPIRDFRSLVLDGGPIERRRTAAGHREMQAAAWTLPTLTPPAGADDNKIHVLTGKRFWHQSAFCLASLQLASNVRITPVFYSDGTLGPDIASELNRILPWSQFVLDAAIEAQLDAVLPISHFPTLRRRRKEYIHLRKLTDIHAFGTGWKLVADSDLLFFRTPVALLQWFDAPHVMGMADLLDNYGYPTDYLATQAGAPLPRRFNVGLYGLNSSTIDWHEVERWCSRQLEDFGPSYLQEQGLTAMIAARQPVTMLPEADYVLMPNLREGRYPQGIMHHYVDRSKRSYFQHGWREIDARLRVRRSSR